MSLSQALSEIRREYGLGLTRSFKERNCGLDLSSVNLEPFIAIDGTKYQSAYRRAGKLADRIIISGAADGLVCAVEFKSGKIGSVADAVAQVQGGLDLAEQLLAGRRVSAWVPLLLFGRAPERDELIELRTPRSMVRFQRQNRGLELKRCGTRLSEVLI